MFYRNKRGHFKKSKNDLNLLYISFAVCLSLGAFALNDYKGGNRSDDENNHDVDSPSWPAWALTVWQLAYESDKLTTKYIQHAPAVITKRAT